MLDEEELRDAALLVFANKQDQPGSKGAGEISEALNLGELKDRNWSIVACSAVDGRGINEGMDWLVVSGSVAVRGFTERSLLMNGCNSKQCSRNRDIYCTHLQFSHLSFSSGIYDKRLKMIFHFQILLANMIMTPFKVSTLMNRSRPEGSMLDILPSMLFDYLLLTFACLFFLYGLRALMEGRGEEYHFFGVYILVSRFNLQVDRAGWHSG